MKRQEYECEKCGLESHVFILDDDDFYAVTDHIKKDHKKWSPECDNPVSNFRVFCDKVEE